MNKIEKLQAQPCTTGMWRCSILVSDILYARAALQLTDFGVPYLRA